jgi:hypothetical protein
MDHTRISLARVLELGVVLSWREVAAIVHQVAVLREESLARHTRPARISTASCMATRKGEIVVAVWAAEEEGDDPMLQLLGDLLAACPAPGELASLPARAPSLNLVDELERYANPDRRRILIAAVAIRGLAAEAARLREERDAQFRAAPGARGVFRRRDMVESIDANDDLPEERPRRRVVSWMVGLVFVPASAAALWWWFWVH